MFQQFKNIDSAFKFVRGFCALIVAGSFALSCFAIYKAYQVMQDSNTRQMVFRAEELLAYLSQVVTLQTGDLIFTGTPPGVGVARKPPVYLKGGDRVEVEIEGLGILRNPVVQG